MRNIFLVIQREFLTRVKKKSFLILTLLAPIIFALTIFVYGKLIAGTTSEIIDVKIADNTFWVGANIQSTNEFKFENIEPEPLETLREKYTDSEKSIVLYIEGEEDDYPVNFSMYSKKSVSIELQEYVRRAINSIVENRKLEEYNITDISEILAKVRTNVDLRTIRWEKDKEDKESNTPVIMIVSYVLAFIIYMFIFMFGSMVIRGVIEEKSNRIVEVIISSVKPFHLMTGKILGIALVGIIQFIMWVLLTVIFFNVIQIFSSTLGSDSGNMISGIVDMFAGINIIGLLGYFLLYFLGGYLLYASMFAAVGSAVESEADSQQLMAPITVPLIVAIMIMVHTFRYPDSSLSFWASIIPFTSPVIMIARIPFGVPLWQILLSLTVLFATFVLMSYITAKIYRVGILMYGKKPSLKEIIKWIKYK
jgi:ABC-2 type transport system permease protein